VGMDDVKAVEEDWVGLGDCEYCNSSTSATRGTRGTKVVNNLATDKYNKCPLSVCTQKKFMFNVSNSNKIFVKNGSEHRSEYVLNSDTVQISVSGARILPGWFLLHSPNTEQH
jgi:hypothetical protein